MKFNVTAEMSDAEIRELAADAARRGLVFGLQYIGEAVDQMFSSISPQASSQMASIMQQAVMAATQMAQQPRTGPVYVRRAPPGGLGVPGGFGPPPGQGYGPLGPPPPGYGPQPPPAGARVVPLSGSGAEVKECFFIEETPRNEASWGCCRCASPNGLQRSECRTCGHRRCGAVVTAAPVAGPPPQIPGVTGVAYPPNGPPPFTPPPPPDQPA